MTNTTDRLRECVTKGGRGSKIPKILRTSFKYRPLSHYPISFVVLLLLPEMNRYQSCSCRHQICPTAIFHPLSWARSPKAKSATSRLVSLPLFPYHSPKSLRRRFGTSFKAASDGWMDGGAKRSFPVRERRHLCLSEAT